MRQKFWKYQALGNDFIIIDFWSNPNLPRKNLTPANSRMVQICCRRRTGIGADGVLFILPSENHTATMRIINADGSVAQMCGNGLRCVARWLTEFGGVTEREFYVDTDSGPHLCAVNPDSDPFWIETGVSGASFKGPVSLTCPTEPLGKELTIIPISVGNPHAVIFTRNLTENRVEATGRFISEHSMFPEQTNVEFVKVLSQNRISVGVFERGAGPTMACGTGACAAASASVRFGYCSNDQPVLVDMPGGQLMVCISDDFRSLTLQGPAELVYEGVWSGEY